MEYTAFFQTKTASLEPVSVYALAPIDPESIETQETQELQLESQFFFQTNTENTGITMGKTFFLFQTTTENIGIAMGIAVFPNKDNTSRVCLRICSRPRCSRKHWNTGNTGITMKQKLISHT